MASSPPADGPRHAETWRVVSFWFAQLAVDGTPGLWPHWTQGRPDGALPPGRGGALITPYQPSSWGERLRLLASVWSQTSVEHSLNKERLLGWALTAPWVAGWGLLASPKHETGLWLSHPRCPPPVWRAVVGASRRSNARRRALAAFAIPECPQAPAAWVDERIGRDADGAITAPGVLAQWGMGAAFPIRRSRAGGLTGDHWQAVLAANAEMPAPAYEELLGLLGRLPHAQAPDFWSSLAPALRTHAQTEWADAPGAPLSVRAWTAIKLWASLVMRDDVPADLQQAALTQVPPPEACLPDDCYVLGRDLMTRWFEAPRRPPVTDLEGPAAELLVRTVALVTASSAGIAGLAPLASWWRDTLVRVAEAAPQDLATHVAPLARMPWVAALVFEHADGEVAVAVARVLTGFPPATWRAGMLSEDPAIRRLSIRLLGLRGGAVASRPATDGAEATDASSRRPDLSGDALPVIEALPTDRGTTPEASHRSRGRV